MIDTLPVPFHLLVIQMPAFYAVMLVLAYLLAWPLASRLPKDAPMGLIMCLFIPAFGHLYILRAVSLAYVAACSSWTSPCMRASVGWNPRLS